jgi:hypothetical protein
MLGWHISVYRLVGAQPAEPLLDALARLERGEKLAVWQAGVGGIDWIRDLVTRGDAVGSLGSGYPDLFFARARDLLPKIREGPPSSRDVWTHAPTDILLPHWEGRTVVHEATSRGCAPDEWLRVEVWDES